jgi:pterin-4a-carbinolamine dehydratase
VVDEAQVMGHRPDVVRRGGRVGVRTATASASGVTQRDVELAHRVREWAQRLGATPSPAR